jgi:hypothetical protein
MLVSLESTSLGVPGYPGMVAVKQVVAVDLVPSPALLSAYPII